MQVQEIWKKKWKKSQQIRYSMTITNTGSPLVVQPIKVQDLH